jgi:hypothetical protein
MKTILLLATLTILASCTKVPQSSPTTSPEKKLMEETKVIVDEQTNLANLQDSVMKIEEMQKEEMMKKITIMDYSGSTIPS